MRRGMACVGVIVLLGSLTLIVGPDSSPTLRDPAALLFGDSEFTVILDPGHGGRDFGTSGVGGMREKFLTLDVALRTEQLLKQSGVPVVVTRRDDGFVPLGDRVALANSRPNRIFVSIHFNDTNRGVGSGIESFYTTLKEVERPDWTKIGLFNQPALVPEPRSAELAAELQEAVVTRTGFPDRGTKDRRLFVTRHTQHPAALVECGFLDNPMEAQMISNSEFRDRIAEGIALGILTYMRNHGEEAPGPAKLAKREVQTGAALR